MTTSAMKSLQDIDVLVAQVSSVTGLSKDQISDQMASADIESFRFDDTILVSPEDFDSIIDAWAAKIKASLHTGEAISLNGKSVLEETEADEIDLMESGDETIDLSASALSWPKGYEKLVTHLYSPTLSKILPENPAQKRIYLEAIVNETEAGQKLLKDLAKAIVKRSKRKLALDKVLEGLKRKIEEMLTKMK